MGLFSRWRHSASVVTAAAMAISGLVAFAPQAQAADLSPMTKAACSNLYSQYERCSVSINYGSAMGKTEGQGINFQVTLGVNKSVQMRAYAIRTDASGKVTGFTPIGAIITVKTDARGYGAGTAPTSPLPAGITGGDHFIVQPADLTTNQIGTSSLHVLPTNTGQLSTFSLNSSRGRYKSTTEYSAGTPAHYWLTQVNYAIPGQQYRVELYKDGAWRSVNQATTGNGVVSSNNLAQINWKVPDTWPTGVYPWRVRNATKNYVILQSTYSIYGSPTGVWGDRDGDRRADILATDSAGDLYGYMTRGTARASSAIYIGRGWQTFTFVATLPDMDRNGWSEMLARRNDGTLWLYKGTGFDTYGSGIQVGRGWQGMRLMAVSPDMDRDGKPEMLTVNAAGDMFRYQISLSGLTYRQKMGHGWDQMRFIIGIGDMSGDGHPDIVAVRSDGYLWRYVVNTSGSIKSQNRVGGGWASFNWVYTPGDVTGDGRRDMVARRSDGLVFLYPVTGTGFKSPSTIMSGAGGLQKLA